MMLADIVFSPEAVSDLEGIFAHVLEDDPAAALHLLERIESHIQSLQTAPHIGRPGRVPNTRELVIARTPFIVPYQVKRGRVEILRVYHAARRWPESF